MSRVGRPKGRSLSKIQEDIEKKYNKALKELAETVAEKIEIEYGRVITAFYNDRVFPYNTNPSQPISYNRTFSLYEASNANDGINSPGVIEVTENGYLSGIEVTASNISGNPYRADKGWVFGRAYYYGIHGFNKKIIDKINRKRRKKDLYEFEFSATKHKGSDRYYLHIPYTSYYSVPGIHFKKPSKEMERRFIQITKKGKMDNMWKQALRNNGL